MLRPLLFNMMACLIGLQAFGGTRFMAPNDPNLGLETSE
jgi:hypothetical protein